MDEADQLRAGMYRLLARLFARAPDSAFLSSLAALAGDETEMGQAISALAAAARETTPEAASDEYQLLFVGISRGLLLPYGSYYLTGFLHEKPLARLRTDMEPLGIARNPEVKEPEDHIAALMEMMAGLIDGSFGAPQPLSVQSEFFAQHVGSWAPHFFADLEELPQARLYAPAGRIGRLFMAIEAAAFEM
ncbi:molecular chaperone TorD family protein [Ostreiculturibacter nitratireducens]|uniref:TorD/DmsD family molecular chaperone n=1 Tax=Ostreiculturibacter nitratireducens TaxID=3075226 RepID=UPI0031B5D635